MRRLWLWWLWFWSHTKQHSSKTTVVTTSLLDKFWSHTKQHSSKTKYQSAQKHLLFWSHTKQHSSKTLPMSSESEFLFWSHTKQHSSKTSNAKKCRFGFVIALLILARFQFCMIPCFFINVIHNSIIIIHYVKQKYNCLKFSVLD